MSALHIFREKMINWSQFTGNRAIVVTTAVRQDDVGPTSQRFHQRKLLTRLRISSHKLMVLVERGRYKKLDVSQRLCQNCNLNLIEDETHFLFQCPVNASDRGKLISVSSEKCLNFTTLQDNERMIWLLNNENVPVLNNLCNFLAKCS